jgi:hypothetical protein
MDRGLVSGFVQSTSSLGFSTMFRGNADNPVAPENRNVQITMCTYSHWYPPVEDAVVFPKMRLFVGL